MTRAATIATLSAVYVGKMLAIGFTLGVGLFAGAEAVNAISMVVQARRDG
jgi:hypothetical protein